MPASHDLVEDDSRRRWLREVRAISSVRYPNVLPLCGAYNQVNKNAWRIPDRAALERYLRLSLDAALQAQVLDPSSEQVRFVVDPRQRRLKDWLDPR